MGAPSGVPDDPRASGRFARRRDVSYCRDLREHSAEFHETRRRMVGMLVVIVGLAVAALLGGLGGIGGLLLGGATILAGFAAFNEIMLRVTDRKLRTDCPPHGD